MFDILVQLYHLLIGTVFVLSCYVIGGSVKRTIQDKEKLLPLHVWMFSLSYLIVVGTFMHPDTNYTPYILGLRLLSLVMGIYALWVLVKYQRMRRD